MRLGSWIIAMKVLLFPISIKIYEYFQLKKYLKFLDYVLTYVEERIFHLLHLHGTFVSNIYTDYKCACSKP